MSAHLLGHRTTFIGLTLRIGCIVRSSVASDATRGVPVATILIIEGEPSVSKVLSAVLRPNHTVITASTANEGDSICDKRPIDLIVTEVALYGDRSGTDFGL